jgi:carbonic anhydrase
MKNDGFSASLYIKGAKNVRVGVPGINGSMTGGYFYQFSEVHFHSLSEHRIEGIRQPLEAQLVHFNTRYKNKKKAMRRRDGLLILSVLFREISRDEGMMDDDDMVSKGDHRNGNTTRVEEEDNPGEVMKFITDHLSGITRTNTDCQFRNPIRLSSLLPSHFFDSFYTYRGSTTSPPCHESVIWVISAYVKPIHSKYLCQFAQLDLPGEKRDVQSLNSRTVYVNSLSCCHDINNKHLKQVSLDSLSYLISGNESSWTPPSTYGSFWDDPIVNQTVVLHDYDSRGESETDDDVIDED